MRIAIALIAALLGTLAAAKLPAPTDDAKMKAAEAAAKGSWNDKVAAYKLCLAMDRTADVYRKNMKDSGKEAPPPSATPPCSDPGPFLATPITPEASKPLEASGAHSPPGTATSPPSTKATASEIANNKK